MIRLLGLSGSLRAVSTNTTLLRAAILLAPPGMTIELYDGLGGLPHFNPDLETGPLPPPVADWYARIAACDGLLVSSPEYARGVPGSLKNALDWLVGGGDFEGKPVAFFQASERGVTAQAALRTILETLSGRIVDAASITVPLLGKQADAAAVAGDPEHAPKIRTALEAYALSLGQGK